MHNRVLKKLCYIKFGNAAGEFASAVDSTIEITGGHNHYVYSVLKTVGDQYKILFLSTGKKTGKSEKNNHSALTIKREFGNGLFAKFINTVYPAITIFLKLLTFRPDYILCVRSIVLIPAFLFSKLFRRPIFVSVHTDLNSGPKILRYIEHHILRKADSVICHGPYLKKQASVVTKSAANVIEYNASSNDLKHFHIENQSLHNLPAAISNEEALIIACIGRVEVRKGVIDLLNACIPLLKKDIGNFELVYAGEGSATDLIKQIAKKHRIEEKIHLLGNVPRPSIAALLKKSWVVVAPSRKSFPEGRCMSVMEALSLNIPVIAPDFGPFPCLVKNKVNGYLFTPDSVTDLQKKISAILTPSIRHKLHKGAHNLGKHDNRAPVSYGEALNFSLNRYSA